MAAILVVASCSGGDGSVIGSGDGSASTATTVVDLDSLFDPVDPEGTAPLVAGSVVVRDDDVSITTGDGEDPSGATESAIDPDGQDALPAVDASSTTAASVSLPASTEIARIVSVSPTHTETLFALGLGDLVVGVDSESDFPNAALEVRRDDLQPDSADLSPLLELNPDVVIIGDDPTGLAQRLDAEGVASFVGPEPDTLDDVYAQIVGIAEVVGRRDLGEDLVASMQMSIATAISSLPIDSRRTYFHEVDPSLVTITPGNFIDSVYGDLGLESFVAADESGFALVTSDQVLSADPDIIMLADVECCAVTVDVLAGRPGWSGLTAVSDGAVVELADYMVMRWGPRVVDLVDAVAVVAASAG